LNNNQRQTAAIANLNHESLLKPRKGRIGYTDVKGFPISKQVFKGKECFMNRGNKFSVLALNSHVNLEARTYDISHLVSHADSSSTYAEVRAVSSFLNMVFMSVVFNQQTFLTTEIYYRDLLRFEKPEHAYKVVIPLYNDAEAAEFGHDVETSKKLGVSIASRFATGLIMKKDGKWSSIWFDLPHEVL
jgi:hypothetical protein